MKKDNLDLNTLRALHQAGQFDQAEKGYLAILRKNPRDAEVLHSLGILYAQQENFPAAILHLQNAVKYQPGNITLQLHLANVLKAHGALDEAIHVLEKTLQEHPDYISGLNNLGTLYYAQNRLDEAVAVYHRAIAKSPEFIDAHYNLGLALIKQEKFADAIFAYQTLLNLAPNHFAARFHLACTLMKQGKLKAAIQEFLTIEEVQPHHIETQSNLATCYLKSGALKEAKEHYLKALELAPDDTQILFNLGVINTEQNNIDTAIQYYQKALQHDPDLFAAHNNLGIAFLAKQHIPYALQHFREALRLQPENKSIQYTVQALSQNQQLTAAPTEYIKTLFDTYADHYDQHLLSALDYQVPAHLLRAVEAVITLSPTSLDILDLGCGTGLSGAAFKPYAKTLTGVDLSEKMLEVAAAKNIYTQAICNDLTTFLANAVHQYDLVIAGDTLVYIGDLSAVFKNLFRVLRKKGWAVFNVEISEHDDYKMNQSGRFSHHKDYLEALAREYHFTMVYCERVITRQQNNEPVYGYVVILQK